MANKERIKTPKEELAGASSSSERSRRVTVGIFVASLGVAAVGLAASIGKDAVETHAQSIGVGLECGMESFFAELNQESVKACEDNNQLHTDAQKGYAASGVLLMAGLGAVYGGMRQLTK